MQVVEWALANKIRVLHPPNGSHYKNPAKVQQLKRMGAEQKGAPDLFVFKEGFDGSQLAIEFKHDGNNLSPEQSDWFADLEAEGWR